MTLQNWDRLRQGLSRGNAGYALTVIWALVGIAVATLTRGNNPTLAWVAEGMAALVALALGVALFSGPWRAASRQCSDHPRTSTGPSGAHVGPRPRGSQG